MLILENIIQALTALKANRTRAVLTMLGIIIGITAVITIMTVGSSMSAALTEQLSSRGADRINVSVTPVGESDFFGMGMSFARTKRDYKKEDYITDERINALKEEFGARIKGVSLTENAGNGECREGSDYAKISLTGVNSDAYESENLTLITGREFFERDYTELRKVAIVSDKLCDNLFGGEYEKAVGQEVTASLNNRFYKYTIVGVYKYQSKEVDFSSDEYEKISKLYIPLETAKGITHNNNGYTTLRVIAASADDCTALCTDITSYMNGKFYRNNQNYRINANTMQSIIEEMNKSLGMVSLVVSIIAGISLLVGGIGVMNIMLVSVTERTREIGTKKALGATNTSIRIQFVMEAMVLCITGGGIGIALGLILGMAVSKLMGYAGRASAEGIMWSLLFSAGIGIFFGLYPANKAAKMNPIDALRYE